MLNILLTGVATLDIINTLSHYPKEDSEVRASAQHIQPGGNACNTAIVMQQLGLHTYLFANLADDVSTERVLSSLTKHHVNTSLCPIQANSVTPTSYITLNTTNGSRSIVHYRDLPELHADDFIRLNLEPINWFHFEARNCSQLLKMLTHAQSFNKPISIELEKNRENIDAIMQYANLLFISKPFAQSRGFKDARSCLEYFSAKFPDIIITCTWGEEGAYAYAQSKIIHQPAYSVNPVVETLGAGDTFNAGIIAAQIKQCNIADTLNFACKLAANKCKQSAFDKITIPHF